MRGTHGRAVRGASWIGGCFLLGALAAVAAAAVDAVEPSEAVRASGPAIVALSDESSQALAAPPEIADEVGMAAGPLLGASATPVAPAPSRPAVSRLELAWQASAPDFDKRIQRAHRTSLELGAWSFDAAARVLATDLTRKGALDRARAAVTLAPDLPAAHMQLARALWLQGGSPMAAIRAVVASLQSIGRHLEASLWFGGSGLFLLAITLVGGGLLCAAIVGVPSLAHAAHDLGHRIPGAGPGFAGWASLCIVLLLPLALGEGVLGLGLVLLAIGLVYGGRAQRTAMLLAAVGIGLGAYPVARYAGAALAALPEDPVAQAAYSVSQGLTTPVELARLQAVADSDTLAARGLAMHARRIGNLGEADALYQRLLGGGAADISLLNNAANVRLELGHMERAIELYNHATSLRVSPVILFNLAQAYGRAFQVENLNETIALAQQAGGDQVAQLTALQGSDTEGFVVDFPIPRSLLWARALEARPGADLAAEYRRSFAPGRLGRDPLALAVTLVLVLLLGALLMSRGDPSRSCSRCGARVCGRCDPETIAGEVCDGCNKLFYQPERTDRKLRIKRVNELRVREARLERIYSLVSVLVPGAAGFLAKRPFSCWLGSVCFMLAISALVWRRGVVPDPLVAGMAAPTVFVGVAVLAGIVYATTVATSLAARRDA